MRYERVTLTGTGIGAANEFVRCTYTRDRAHHRTNDSII
jgi:hypothetical protein